VTSLARSLTRFAGVLGLASLLSGCAVSAGGFSFSLLQNASVSLHTGSHDGDPNAP